MIALRLCWLIFALWYMWWASTPHLVSTNMDDVTFVLEKGIRYGCGVTSRRIGRSKLQCASACAKEKSCHGFNFGSGHCELLSEKASGKSYAPGWNHWYITGTYQGTRKNNFDCQCTLLKCYSSNSGYMGGHLGV